jgi:hypothetical protein
MDPAERHLRKSVWATKRAVRSHTCPVIWNRFVWGCSHDRIGGGLVGAIHDGCDGLLSSGSGVLLRLREVGFAGLVEPFRQHFCTVGEIVGM